MKISPLYHPLAGLLALLALSGFAVKATATETDERVDSAWSDAEISMLRSLSLHSLTPLQADPVQCCGRRPTCGCTGTEAVF